MKTDKTKKSVARKKPSKRKIAVPSPKKIDGVSKVIKAYTDAIVKVKDETISALKRLGILK